MKVYVCDRCGKRDILPEDIFHILCGINGASLSDMQKFDVCGDCYNKHDDFMTNGEDIKTDE